MRAADTNVLVRLVVRDSAEQVRLAESFIASGAWVSHLVLAEAMWVLDTVYDRTPEQVAGAIDMLLNHKDLAIQDAELVAAALEHFRTIQLVDRQIDSAGSLRLVFCSVTTEVRRGRARPRIRRTSVTPYVGEQPYSSTEARPAG
jgi:predicted nucleic-acid-binding protein